MTSLFWPKSSGWLSALGENVGSGVCAIRLEQPEFAPSLFNAEALQSATASAKNNASANGEKQILLQTPSRPTRTF